ncbi:hypothetical protein PRIPAC_87704 [Pristionchus pacificus]|uniref:Uncharacterized protein n=1 Tax=Pristionchus pacificus TaxID=54126 RepID=A0A2A6B8T0_PRIPA|nr:hypothetical protein PRIPAC_87704 [Pristionchus pacificus]|eukprot:PDM62286.1 hypothetical protein PRIPAC_51728 [Pristionchus pacificus]
MLRFLFSLISFFCLLLPFISAFPNMMFNDEDMSDENGYRYYQNKRALVLPNNALMLRNFPILRRV